MSSGPFSLCLDSTHFYDKYSFHVETNLKFTLSSTNDEAQ